ncbi:MULTISPECIES: hypothetical protein [unclassified Psychrobacter]|uniref:hypothetical protein n=1 Tax=unclassified Psychrobacter TaxID=196806 RepID=UPI0025B31522|nr:MULTISPECIES: hypothetical protein [unclassified Psychrobacter]MDN3453513.1 hypothetical protein [Psychrobacter sp. APC 3350]MDN3502923.1 hypothetical protein [Psychrobacter sp. 5A.1]
MDQFSPPNPPIKKPTRTNKQSIIAITLAVLLHILVVAIIYFSVFQDKVPSTSEQLSTNTEQPLPTVIITENKPESSTDKAKLTTKKDTPPDSNTPPDSLKTVNQTPNINKKSPSKNTASQDNTTVKPVNVDEKTANTDLATNNQPSTPEYTLKKTKEYEQLDEVIDKDSEQLSKLIIEVRRRNQDQIQQHQIDQPVVKTPKPVEKPAPNSSVQKPELQKEEAPLSTNNDYPIAPIKSLNNE